MKLTETTPDSLVAPTKRIRVGVILDPMSRRMHTAALRNLVAPYTSTHEFILDPESPCAKYITTSEAHIEKLVGVRDASLNDFAGSILNGNTLVLNYLEQARTVDYYTFLSARYLRKLLKPETFYHAGQFTWALLASDNQQARLNALNRTENSVLQAWDIETRGSQNSIICVGISLYMPDNSTYTYVVELNTLDDVKFLRMLALTPSAKIFQNGQYDLTYLIRYSITPVNYVLDTLGLFHAWLCELPRRLHNITAFAVADIPYWKDEASGDRMEFLRYNARDAFGTLHACISLLMEMPQWAKNNYSKTFPLQYPCLLAGLHGLGINKAKLEAVTLDAANGIEESLRQIRAYTGDPHFNPGSPKQVLKLFHVYGAKDLESTDAAHTSRFASRSPLTSRIAAAITTYREATKYHSNYATVMLLNDRLHYTLNPFGTESGRFSSAASHFAEQINYRKLSKNGKQVLKPKWEHYGFQIQNVPEEAKVFIQADEGFLLYELDYSQAESRTTGYLAQDLTLINAVETSEDFHSYNASKFFGIPFDELWDSLNHVTLNKPIRNLAKRTNHGANYNMAEAVLIATMGESNMWKARALLGLPTHYTLKDIAHHLLVGFCQTYPRLKGVNYIKAKNHAEGVRCLIHDKTYYGEIITEVAETGMLVSPLGWTRRCFADPTTNKPALNAYVAHPSQNLSVACINRAMLRIYGDAELRNFNNFRLNAQIHDSLLFQIRVGMEYNILPRVQALFNEPITVHGRTMLIPYEASKGKTTWK